MVKDALGSLWAAPRPSEPPSPSRWDWLLAVVLAALGLADGVLRDAVVWPAIATGLGVALPFTLPWRRSFPALMFALGVGAFAVYEVAILIATGQPTLLPVPVIVGFILTHALARWASGREAVIGVGIALVFRAVAQAGGPDNGVADVIAAPLIWLTPAMIGAANRHRATLREGRIAEARLRERGRLARELHDTVAHHVSAIAIQAQAGRILAASRPAAAAEALEVIEEAASRTLSEMRAMVSVLRRGEDAEMTPAGGLRDIERFAHDDLGGPPVDVHLSGDLEDLGPSVEAGLFRMAQESITNARRHARHARRIAVSIAGNGDDVRLTVSDDGEPAATSARSAHGYGLVGMSERATLLGGRLDAGPAPGRGWIVTAVIPRTRTSS